MNIKSAGAVVYHMLLPLSYLTEFYKHLGVSDKYAPVLFTIDEKTQTFVFMRIIFNEAGFKDLISFGDMIEKCGFRGTRQTIVRVNSFRLPKGDYTKKSMKAYLRVRSLEMQQSMIITDIMKEWKNNTPLRISSMSIDSIKRVMFMDNKRARDPKEVQQANKPNKTNANPWILLRTAANILNPEFKLDKQSSDILISLPRHMMNPTGIVQQVLNIKEYMVYSAAISDWRRPKIADALPKLVDLKKEVEQNPTSVSFDFPSTYIIANTNALADMEVPF